MNRLLKFIVKHWTRVWLIGALILVIGVTATFAAFTSANVVKRVVSTMDMEVELFSSNCMRQDITNRMISVRSYSVTVCNYDQDMPLTFNPAQMDYVFRAELQVKSGSEYLTMSQLHTKLLTADPVNGETTYQGIVNSIGNNYYVSKTEDDSGTPVSASDSAEHYFTSGNNYTVEFGSQSLAPNVSSTDRFQVTVASSDLGEINPKFYVHVWAEPSGNVYHTIHSRIYGGIASSHAASWHGSLKETNCSTIDYDFYNYIITGNGVGTVDILWNDEYFNVNEFFFSALAGNSFVHEGLTVEPVEILSSDENYGTAGLKGNYTGWKMVTLNVDSINGKSRYELQLYKANANTSYTDKTGSGGLNETASLFIQCFFTEN